MVFELTESELLEQVNLEILSIVEVLVAGNLTPVSGMLRLEVVILLCSLDAYGLNLDLEVLFRENLDLLSHCIKEVVQAVYDVLR